MTKTLVKYSHNGTLLQEFLPGGADWHRWKHVKHLCRPPYPFTPFLCIMQGEAEMKVASGGSQALSEAWGANCETLITSLQNEIGAAFKGIIIGQVSSAIHGPGDNGDTPWKSIVRAQQESTAAAAANRRLVDATGVPLQTDVLHYTAEGMITLGQLYAAQLVSIWSTLWAPTLGAVPINPFVVCVGQSNMQGHYVSGTTFTAANLGPIPNWRWACSDSVSTPHTTLQTSLDIMPDGAAHFGIEQKLAVDLSAAAW